MNSNPKVHVVDGNSGVHSSVTQQAGISLSRYWSGEASGTEKKAYVFKFFFVNIPPSETVSWMFFSTTHNIQRSVFRLTFRSQCQLSCRSYILQLIIVNPTNINHVWQILQFARDGQCSLLLIASSWPWTIRELKNKSDLTRRHYEKQNSSKGLL